MGIRGIVTHSIGIVIPAYEPDVPQLVSYVDSLRSVIRPKEIRVELDAVRSDSLADRLSDAPVDLHRSPERRGKGAAITHGFERLDTEVLAFADADGSTPATSLADVIRTLDAVDLSVGSRRHPNAIVESHQTIVRRFLGDGFAWFARQFLTVDLYDFQCGAKAVTLDAWREVREHLREPGFAWDLELVATAAALERSINEVPVRWQDHPDSTVAPVSTTVDLARALFEIRRRTKRLSDEGDRVAIDRTARGV
jgi:hypothetical protein